MNLPLEYEQKIMAIQRDKDMEKDGNLEEKEWERQRDSLSLIFIQ